MRGKNFKILNPPKDIEPEWWGKDNPNYLRCIWHTLTPKTVGTKHFWFGFQIIEPGRAGLMHLHNYEEMYFVLSGKALIRGEEEEHVVGPYDTIFFPPGTMHQPKNIGTENFVFVWVYAPLPAEVSEEKYMEYAKP